MSEREPIPHPEVQAYLDSLSSRPPSWEPPLAERRREAKLEVLSEGGDPDPVAFVENVSLGDFDVRLYLPKGDEGEVLVWLHGGGWLFHDVDAFDSLTRALANAAGCAVMSVDYRLAPEHPYPTGVEDSWAATLWASERFEKIAIGGDSAGGNLAAVVALRSREAYLSLALQLLVYPVTDYAVDSPFYNEFRLRYAHFARKDGYGAQYQDGIRWLWENYVPDADRRTEPEASPLRAASLRGVAPALIIIGEHDILRDENEGYARRLESDGVRVELVAYPGQIHGFFHRLGLMEDARRAVRRAAEGLREAFDRAAFQ